MAGIGVFTPGLLSVFAGQAFVSGFSGDGGAATSAEINGPVGVAVDSEGNLYIGDSNNNRIRKVTVSTGEISTIAGVGEFTDVLGDGGPATSAQLNSPTGVALDSSGNVYIADTNDSLIRKITVSTGIITTVAGNASLSTGFAGDGGPATSAELENPVAVAVDASGNIFISDTANNRVRMVTASTGIISTIAGTGTAGFSGDGGAATSAMINGPEGIAVDTSGNAYFADVGNSVIRKITVSTGIISTIAGTGRGGFSGDGGPATSAELSGPASVAVDPAGNVYIGDENNEAVRKVTVSTGIISTIAGRGGLTPPTAATNTFFATLAGVAVDIFGNVYVSDSQQSVVDQISPNGVISFGTTPVGIPVTVDAVFSNDGNSSLTVSASSVSGGGGFTAPSSGFTLASGESTTVPITFTPTTQGTPTGVLTLESNGVTTPQTATLSGAATQASTFTQVTSNPNPSVFGVGITFDTLVSTGGGVPTGTVLISSSATDSTLNGTLSTVTTTNLVADSGLQFGTEFWTNTIPIVEDAGGMIGGNAFVFTGDGSASGFVFNQSAPITVVPGDTYTLSGFIDATNVTSGNPVWAVFNTAVTTNLDSVSLTPGTKGRVSTTFVVPSGTTQVVVLCDTDNCTVANGASLLFSNPQLEQASSVGPYVQTGTSASTGSGGSTSPSGGSFPAATQTITAAYSGDANNEASSATLVQVVTQATPTISISNIPTAPIFGGGFVVEVDYTGTGSPTLAVTSSNSAVCSVSGDNVTFTGAGTCTLTASASATTDDFAVTGSPQTVTVAKATTTLSLTSGTNPSTFGELVGLTATIGGSPSATGMVSFAAGGVSLGNVTLSSDTATLNTASIPGGTNTVTATYAGDANNNGSTATVSQTVNPASQTITFTQPASPVTVGVAPIGLTATASSGLGITFSVLSGPGVISGSTLAITGPGTVSVAANQAGNADFTAAAQVTKSVTVNTIGAFTPGGITLVAVTPYEISLIAGTGTAGDGPFGGSATSAALNGPRDVAVNGAGTVFIADLNNNVVEMVSTSGVISVFAGTGTAGFSGNGGAATSAELSSPHGVAFDASGNVYIADADNNVIRIVNSAGVISTFAGNNTAGFSGDGGPATSAELSTPVSIALDPGGNLYISDRGNTRIRLVTASTGIITTVAGNGTAGFSGDGGSAASAELGNLLQDITVDSLGNLYIADSANNRIRLVNTSGGISTIAGTGTAGFSGDGGPATSAELSAPFGVAVDAAGDVYFSDGTNSRIRMITASGTITTIAGGGADAISGGTALNAELISPSGLSISSNGTIFFADLGLNIVGSLGPSGALTFPSQAVASTSSNQGVVVRNVGNSTITFSAAPAITGDFAVASSNTLTSGSTLSAGASGSIPVTFTPTATGTRTGTLTLTDNATNLQQVLLSGSATQNADTTVTVTSSLNPSNFEQAVTFTATVPSGGTGTVEFIDNGMSLGVVTVESSSAALTTSTLQAGSNSIVAVYSGDSNFAGATSQPISQVVDAIAPTITFSVPTQTFGEGPFPVSAISNSGGAITFSLVSGPATVTSAGVVTLTAAGSVTLEASQAANGNFTAGTQEATFTVNPESQTITFGAIANQTFGGAPFTVSATASSGLAVTFTSETTSVCTVSGNTVTIVGVGTGTIAASQAGNADFSAATNVSQSFTVGQFTPTITISNIPTNAAVGGSFTATYNYNGNGTPSVASSNTAICTTSGNVVTFVGAGTASLTASATATTDDFAVEGTPQSITVGKNTPTITASASPTSIPFQGSFTVTASVTGASNPTGTVTFPAIFGAATVDLASGTASTGTLVSESNPGVITGIVTYNGDANNNPATATATIVVTSVTPTIEINNIPVAAQIGQSFTATYTYTGTGTPVESVSSSNSAVCSVSATNPSLVTFVGAGTASLMAFAGPTVDDTAAVGPAQSITVVPVPSLSAFVNPNYPNRIELYLGPFTGPLIAGDVVFNPGTALEVYVGGVLTPIMAFGFDVPNNRYLLFTQNTINTALITQVIYHMPTPVFTASGTIMPGFALVAGVSNVIDPVNPSISLMVPSVAINVGIQFTWTAFGVAQLSITTTSGFSSGLFSAQASAGVVFAPGSASSGNFSATLAAFDSSGNPILLNGVALTDTIPLTIT
jgi:hypothetical protein